jgi:hypothetical protein
MTKIRIILRSQAAQTLFLFGLTSVLCFAQSSPFGKVAQGTSTEAVSIVKWVGIIICIVAGITMAGGGSHGSHMGAKISGVIIGLTMALFASPIVSWLQTLA